MFEYPSPSADKIARAIKRSQRPKDIMDMTDEQFEEFIEELEIEEQLQKVDKWANRSILLLIIGSIALFIAFPIQALFIVPIIWGILFLLSIIAFFFF
ncbi:hypothetical protein F9B74_01290 [Pelistega sp. NLN82]|uniref:Uncharacterized protein n=1 Tax=Pelistega ratti TaxID=2652177 RepID=A0A6L9Y578_9BURK|nr:hypothetical protein [Pelistega ratti]NEN74964.1 hypothetical protein [Pelistega ratti]